MRQDKAKFIAIMIAICIAFGADYFFPTDVFTIRAALIGGVIGIIIIIILEDKNETQLH